MKVHWEQPQPPKHSWGASAACKHTVTWWDLPPGHYMLTACQLLQPVHLTVFAYFSGLLSTFSDCCRYEQGSSSHVHFSPQQCSITHVCQRVRELHRWAHDKMLLTGYLSSIFLLVAIIWKIFKCLNVVFFSVSGNQGNVSQTGDTLGKALASVSMPHLNPIRPASVPRYVLTRKQELWKLQKYDANRK